MIVDVRHTTVYDYGERIGFARCLLHLTPRDTANQRVLSAALQVEPGPAEREDQRDFFGNAALMLAISEPHTSLAIRATARIAVQDPAWPDPEATPAHEDVAAAAAAWPDLSGESPVHHLFASRYVPLLSGARDLARPFFAPRRPVLAAALDLTRALHAGFTYDPEATDVSTPITQVLETRRGVCQDFAHLMIAALRGMGLPAAYVSGYLRTLPPPGRERLVGADATHAWVALWCGPGQGWVGLDPTNGITTNTDHLVLAVGRDYQDVAPVSGVLLAAQGQRLTVSVDVVPVDESQPPQALAG